MNRPTLIKTGIFVLYKGGEGAQGSIKSSKTYGAHYDIGKLFHFDGPLSIVIVHLRSRKLRGFFSDGFFLLSSQ